MINTKIKFNHFSNLMKDYYTSLRMKWQSIKNKTEVYYPFPKNHKDKVTL